MTENETFSSSEYYRPFQIPDLINRANVERKKKGEPPLTISTFYRRVEKGVIGSYPPNRQKRQKAGGYRKADVDAFLRGELGGGRRIRKQNGSLNMGSYQRGRAAPSIDMVLPDDLPALGYMEAQQLDWQQAIPVRIILSWLKKNEHLYWMRYNPKNRRGLDGVLAVLGVLPLREELIQRLLRGELSPSQITADEILTYEPGQTYTCLVVSTTALPEYQTSARLLLQHALAYWCENSIRVTQLFALGEMTREGTSTMWLVSESFFAPWMLSDQPSGPMAWSLLFDRFNPSLFVQEYQKCIERKENLERREKERMNRTSAILDDPIQETLPIERELEGSIKKKIRDFDRLDHRLFKVDANGRLDADRLKEAVWFRRVRTDDDIRASLRINASLFGDSKKFTEDELVAQRRTWLAVNPDIYRVLEVDGEVVGFISAFPIPMLTIERILRSEIRMGDVGIDELLVYEPGVPVSVYLQTIGVHKKYQGQEKRTLGIYMASGFRDLVNGLGKRGIEIQAIYTRSDETDGINMSYSLGFQKMPAIPDVNKLIFKLDFSRDDLPFLFEYQRVLEEYHAKQSAHAIRSASR